MTTQNNYISQSVPVLVRMFFERCDPEDCPIYLDGPEFEFRVVGLEHAGFEAQQVCEDTLLLSAIRDAARRWLWENAIVDFCNRSDYGTTGNFIRLALPQLPVFAAKSIGDVFDPSDTVALLAACLMVKDEMEKGK